MFFNWQTTRNSYVISHVLVSRSGVCPCMRCWNIVQVVGQKQDSFCLLQNLKKHICHQICRNSFVPVIAMDGSVLTGQRQDSQLNNLDELEAFLGNESKKYWEVLKGYIFGTEASLQALRAVIAGLPRCE